MSLAEIIGPPFYMWIYSTTRNAAPNAWWGFGAPFLVAAVISFIALVFLWRSLRNFKGLKTNRPQEVEFNTLDNES
jgi:MFS family permease